MTFNDPFQPKSFYDSFYDSMVSKYGAGIP